MNNKINLDKEIGNIDLNDLKQIKTEVEKEKSIEVNSNKTDISNESNLLDELSKYAEEATEKLKNTEEERKKQLQIDKSKKEQSKYILIGTILAIVLCLAFFISGLNHKTHSGKHGKLPANQTKGHNEFSAETNSNYFNNSESNNNTPSGNLNSGFENNPM